MSVQYEWAENKQEKGQATDDVLAECFTQEDRDGIDAVFFVACNIFEVFEGKGQKIRHKKIEEECEGERGDAV